MCVCVCVCVCVDFCIQHATYMSYIILPSVERPLCFIFSPLSHKDLNFWVGGGVIKNKMCFDFLYNFV